MSICFFPSLQFLWRIFFFSRPVILFSQMKILLSCCHSSPDMALLLVDIQHTPNRPRHGRVDLLETVGTVLMFGRYNLERSYFLRLIQTHLSQDLQASVNKYLHFPPYLLLSSESIVLTADWSSGVHL